VVPAVSGIHHVTFVVRDLDAGIAWFGSVLGARHRPRFDHHDAEGVLFGVVLELDGFAGMIEIRLATDDYPLPGAGYDPVTFEVADDAELARWLEHLDAVGEVHSSIKRRRTGQSIEFVTPDGTLLRLFTAPAGGFDEVPFQEQHVDH
jgi:catechol 2,3-dioxygenase-like lactoylglutathione lyase family enzyme